MCDVTALFRCGGSGTIGLVACAVTCYMLITHTIDLLYAENTSILEESYRAAFTFQWPKGEDIERIQLFLHQTSATLVDEPSSEVHTTVQISDATLVDEISFASIPLCTKMISMAREHSQRVFDITGNNGAWLVSHINGSEMAAVQLSVTVYGKCTDGTFGLSEASATNSTDGTRIPRLVITFKHSDSGNVKLRHKRTEEASSVEQEQVPRYCTGNNSECCLRNITVDFHRDLHFTFIKSPRNFTFGYCAGICKPWYNEQLQTPGVYTILAAFNNSNNPRLRPCCTPSAYESLNVLTNSEETPQIIFNNAVVTDCQCN